MSPSPLRPRRVEPIPLDALAARLGAATVAAGSSGSPRLPGSAGPAGAARRPVVTGVTLRAQQVRPGDLFAALPGSQAHGAQFAADAARAGAAAVLTDAAGAARISADGSVDLPLLVAPDARAVLGAAAAVVYGDPSARLDVLGITGTSGKTTTCYLLEAALAAAGVSAGLIGTVQIRIAGQGVPSALTTPEAPELQALFAVMAERGVRAVAMEVSSHALALGRVSGTRFAVGAFTNLSQDHLDFHGDMEHYFAAKSLLFDGRAAAHVIDVDDAWGARLAAAHPGSATVSATGRADVTWSVARADPGPAGRTALVLRGPAGQTVETAITLPGAFNIGNAVLALACVDAAGFDVRAAARGLADVVVPGRMQRIDAGQPFLAVVDYAHKPAALAAVLDAVADGLAGRLIVVIGAGGDRDHGKRSVMGAAAATRADLVFVTDDNPRSEDPAAIRAALLDGARSAGGRARIAEIGDRREAIRSAIAAARPGDAVVVAGKGHEMGQEIAGVVHPFSDEEEVRAALQDGRVRP